MFGYRLGVVLNHDISSCNLTFMCLKKLCNWILSFVHIVLLSKKIVIILNFLHRWFVNCITFNIHVPNMQRSNECILSLKGFNLVIVFFCWIDEVTGTFFSNNKSQKMLEFQFFCDNQKKICNQELLDFTCL
jgi:hypothetical protein